jgi:hypothetical protein
VELEVLTDHLRAGYFRSPGATEEGFTRDLPGLIEEHARQQALKPEPELASPIHVRL